MSLRWNTITGILLAHGRSPTPFAEDTEGERAEARARVRRDRADYDQALAAVRADIAAAGPAPPHSAFVDERAGRVLAGVAAEQQRVLDRLSAFAAVEEASRIAVIEGEIDYAVSSRLRHHGQFRELNVIQVQAARLAQLEFPQNDFVDVWFDLFELDTRAEVAAHDVRIAVLRGRQDDARAAQSELRSVAAGMRALTPAIRATLPRGRRPFLPEGLVRPDILADLDGYARALPQLPNLVASQAPYLEELAASWSDLAVADVVSETDMALTSVLMRLSELAERAPPPL